MLIFDHDENCELENFTADKKCNHPYCFCLTRFYIEHADPAHEMELFPSYLRLGASFGPINFWEMVEKKNDQVKLEMQFGQNGLN